MTSRVGSHEENHLSPSSHSGNFRATGRRSSHPPTLITEPYENHRRPPHHHLPRPQSRHTHANGRDIEEALDSVRHHMAEGYLAVRAQAGVPGVASSYGAPKPANPTNQQNAASPQNPSGPKNVTSTSPPNSSTNSAQN